MFFSLLYNSIFIKILSQSHNVTLPVFPINPYVFIYDLYSVSTTNTFVINITFMSWRLFRIIIHFVSPFIVIMVNFLYLKKNQFTTPQSLITHNF